MKLITLGTSHGDPTYSRFNSSSLFCVGEDLYLVDAGAPVNALLIRNGYKLENLRAVFITHMHEDHVGGLSGLVMSLVKYAIPEQHTEIFFPEQEAIEPFIGWMNAMHRKRWTEELLTFSAVPEGLFYNKNNVTVKALPTRHLENEGMGFSSFAYEIKAEDKRVIYTGDLKGDFSDFPMEESGADVCVCECTHFDMHNAGEILRHCSFGRMIFNHVANAWHGEGEKELRRIIDRLPFPCEIAHDSDEFEL